MPLGTKVDLGPGHIVLHGDPAPPKGHIPQFSAHMYCGQTVAHISYSWALAGEYNCLPFIIITIIIIIMIIISPWRNVQLHVSSDRHSTIFRRRQIEYSQTVHHQPYNNNHALTNRLDFSSLFDTMDYVILTCAQKLTSSRLNLPHGAKQKRLMKKQKKRRCSEEPV